MKKLLLCLSFLSALLVQSVNAENKSAENKQVGKIDHLGLSVSNLEASTNFFVDILGFTVSGRSKKYPAVFIKNGKATLSLWQTDDEAISFDRKKNVGLHHLALKVSSFEALDALYESAKKASGVVIEFSPELFYGGPAKHMMLLEPSGNRIELIHRPRKK